MTNAVLDMPMPLQAPRREENNKSLDHIDLHCRCRFCHRLGTLGYLSSHRSAKTGYTFIHIIYYYLISMFISNQYRCSFPTKVDHPSHAATPRPPTQMEGFFARLRAPNCAPTPVLLTADSGLLREEAKRLLAAEFHLDEAHCKTDFLY